ncbi:hypothetical protein BgiMline_019854 [Biomphalaria glabrata]|nr:hypothetical protein BgiMline_029587 [Biomphalaria glabrata]
MNVEEQQKKVYDSKYVCEFDDTLLCTRSKINLDSCEGSCNFMFMTNGPNCGLGVLNVNTYQNITAVQWSKPLNVMFAKLPITEDVGSKHDNLPLILGITLGAAFLFAVILIIICCRQKIKKLCVRADTVYNISESNGFHIYSEINEDLQRSVDQQEYVSPLQELSDGYLCPIDQLPDRSAASIYVHQPSQLEEHGPSQHYVNGLANDELFHQNSSELAEDGATQAITCDQQHHCTTASYNSYQPSQQDESDPSQQFVNNLEDNEPLQQNTTNVAEDVSSQNATSDHIHHHRAASYNQPFQQESHPPQQFVNNLADNETFQQVTYVADDGTSQHATS